MSLFLDNYFSFFFFFPIAFSKIPFKVAPDLVAPSPNLAINVFSSSIWAAFTLNLIRLLFKSSSVILASNEFPGEKTSGLASDSSFAKSFFLINTINFLSLSIETFTPDERTSCTLVVIISPLFFLFSLNQSNGSFSRALFENLILSSFISIILTEIVSFFLNF